MSFNDFKGSAYAFRHFRQLGSHPEPTWRDVIVAWLASLTRMVA